MFRILIVEDDKELNATVCDYLKMNGYQADGVLNANDGFNMMYGTPYDMVISDIMMPETDGFTFAKEIRSVNQEIPILFMSARDDFSAKKIGFRIGVDDYMVKPIDLDELLLRTEALLRRAKVAATKHIEVGNLVLDAEGRTVAIAGEEISLTAREFNILYKLLSYPKKTFTRTQLMDEFWDADSSSGPRVVDVYITKLRDKLSGANGVEIQTVHGMGYKAVIG